MDDVHVPGRWHLGEVTTSGKAVPDFLGASELPAGVSASVGITHAGIPLDFCLTSFAVPVARKQLADVVAAIAGHDIELVPVLVDGDSGFVVIHVRRLVPCLDERRSQFVKWTDRDHRYDLAGGYRMVTNLVVDPRRIPASTHVFRIEGWPVALIVSSSVKDSMEDAGCEGAKFDEV